MKIHIGKQGIVTSDGDDPEVTVVIDAPTIHTQNVYCPIVTSGSMSTGPAGYKPINTTQITGGTGISITTGTYGQAVVSLSADLTTDAQLTVWRDFPSGTIDSSNLIFTLADEPEPPESIMLIRNGLILCYGIDFDLSGSVLTFKDGNAPTSGSIMWARYHAVLE